MQTRSHSRYRLGCGHLLIALLIALYSYRPSHAADPEALAWTPVTNPEVVLSLDMDPPRFLRRFIQARVSVANQGTGVVLGALRLVVEYSLYTVLGADGITQDGEPYFLLLDEAQDLAPGESLSREISAFRGRLVIQDGLAPRFRLEQGSVDIDAPPRADAGVHRTVSVGDWIILDASGSSDPEGSRLTYRWELTEIPESSFAELSDPNVLRPSFLVDVPGTYEIRLIVDDGVSDSNPSRVLIGTENSPPIADAGTDRLAAPGDLVRLDASASSDADSDRLHFRWALSAAPPTSRTSLDRPYSVGPRFFIDEPGEYVARLVVSDRFGLFSKPPTVLATVVISTDGLRPTADAGPPLYTLTGDWLSLDGSASFDPDGDALDYRWALLHAPAGSNAELEDNRNATASLIADLPGDYVAQLVVNDGKRDSIPDTTLIVAEGGPENRAPTIISSPPEKAVADVEYRYAVSAMDPDFGDRLSFSVTAAPWGMVIDPDTGLVHWTPDASHIGNHAVRIRVADVGGLETEQSYTLQVAAPANRPPAIDSYPPQSIHMGEEYLYESSARDPDADPLIYVLEQAPAGMVVNSQSGAVRWAPSSSGVYDVSIRVADDKGEADTQTFSIRVFDQAIPPSPVVIAPPVEPSTLPSFLEGVDFLLAGESPIQTGLQPDVIEPHRAAVIRGRVLTRSGDPLAGARVSIQGRPELGSTLSRADGWFDLLVNGGGELVLDYSKDGWLPVQRRVTAPWEDFAVTADVVLTALDPNATDVLLGASADGYQVARGSLIDDGDGARQATLLFEPGTSAELVFSDGTRQPLDRIRVRATEYSVGDKGIQAMPGELPASSGYTYAVELSADEAITAGASHLELDRPVSFYIDNFLGFPVGTRVPVGWYDLEKAAWLPSPDGLVIEIVGADPQGRALIDTDGSGNPASPEALASLGLSDAERGQLAALYAPGTSLWRSRHDHLTPWDCNFPFVPDSDDPRAPDIPPEIEDEPPECDAVQSGSAIRASAGILGESLPIAGTDYALGFRSDRTHAYRSKRAISAAATGSTPPDGLLRVDMRLSIAGQTQSFSFGPESDQQIRVPWSHQDAYGRPLSGPVTGQLETCYIYGLRRVAARGDVAASFGSIAGSFRGGGGGRGGAALDIRGDRSAFGVNLCTTWPLNISDGGAVTTTAQLGGWSFSAAHSLDTRSGLLQRGDGTEGVGARVREVYRPVVSAGALSATAPTPADTAGSDTPANLSATTASALLVEENGSILLAEDSGLSRHFGDRPTPVPAAAGLLDIRDLAQAPDGRLFLIAREGSGGHRVYRLEEDGTRSPVAGSGEIGCAPNSGGAIQVPLSDPRALAVTADGSVYIADTACHRVYRMRPDGTLVRTAGTGVDGHNGDFDSAVLAAVGAPTALALGPNEDLYIGSAHGIVRRMEPSGFMTRVAGTGMPGYAGDGGPAIDAQLGPVGALAMAADGTLYIDDTTANARLRKVSLTGIIETVAGDGNNVPIQSGAQALGGSLGVLSDIALGYDGRLYLAEQTGKVWSIARPLLPLPWQEEILVPEGEVVHVFDRRGRHLRVRDALTGSLLRTLHYDEDGRLDSVADFPGRVTRIERGADAFAVVAPDGQRTEVTLGRYGQLEQVALPHGISWTTQSTSDGSLLGLTDPRGETTSFVYDANGRLVTDTNPLGGGWGIDTLRDAGLTETRMTSGEGRLFRYRRERRDGVQLIENTAPDGTVQTIRIQQDGTTQSLSADGNRTSVSYAADPRWGYAKRYPAYGLLTTPGGRRLETTTSRQADLGDSDDPFSLIRLTSTKTVNARTWTSIYDATTRTETTTSPERRRTSTQVDQWRRPIREEISGLAPLLYRYNAQGRISEVQHGEGDDARLTLFDYDDKGYLETVTDPIGRTFGFRNDDVGRVLESSAPDGSVTSFDYDPADNLTALAPPGRPAHLMNYDALGQEIRYDPPALAEGTGGVDTNYNLDREPIRLSHDLGPAIDYRYDEIRKDGHLDRRITPEGDTRFDYDQAGRLGTQTGPTGERIDYAYDGSLVVSEIFSGTLDATLQTDWKDEFLVAAETLVTNDGIDYPIAYGYDGDGLLTQAGDIALDRDPDNGLLAATSLGHVRTGRSYTPFGELERFEATFDGAALFAIDYRRDKLGRMVEKTETIDGTNAVTAYTYDLAGRLETVGENGALLHTYGYDANGNRTHIDGIQNASYDDQDRILAHTPLHQRPIPDTAVSYLIDPRNRRIGKTSDGKVERLWVYRDRLNPIAELNPDGTLRALFVYADQGHVPASMVHRDTAGKERSYRILTDHLGSPRIVVDADSGAIAQRLDYDVWGRVTRDTNPGFQPFGFAGGLYDPDTGLVRFGARDYDPFTGRWTAKDPIGLSSGTNLFEYSLSDPGNLVDTSGLWSVSIGAGGTGQWSALSAGASTSASADSNGNICLQFTTCTGLGFGYFGGLGITAGASSGDVCDGTSETAGPYYEGGKGVGGSGTIQSGEGGISGATGLFGIGVGYASGFQNCKTRTICI